MRKIIDYCKAKGTQQMSGMTMPTNRGMLTLAQKWALPSIFILRMALLTWFCHYAKYKSDRRSQGSSVTFFDLLPAPILLQVLNTPRFGFTHLVTSPGKYDIHL